MIPAVQKGYSIFLLSECVFSAALFYSAALLLQRFGLGAAFLTLPAVCVIGAVLMFSLHAGQLPTPNWKRIRGIQLGGRAILALLALFSYFCGQSALNSSLIGIGGAIGVGFRSASGALAAAIIFGFVGSATSRWLGVRCGMRLPIVTAALVLAATVVLMTLPDQKIFFFLGVFWIQITTFFIVPYFFTTLAVLEKTGRAASIGPAFLLTGAALGPSLAAWVSSNWNIHALGTAACLALLTSVALTIAALRDTFGDEAHALGRNCSP